MAQSSETGNPTVTANNPIADLLATPLSPDWAVEGLAEQVLGAIAAQRSEEAQEFVLDADTATDRQSRRILRPLLACLAAKSAAEAETPVNLYGGRLLFQRPGPSEPVWISGQFENRSGTIRVAFQRSPSPPQNSDPGTAQSPVLAGAGSPLPVSPVVPSRLIDGRFRADTA
jgi:hypothetical protein